MNKPVAWMQVHHKNNKPTKFSLVQTWEDDIPLYTHPIKDDGLLDTRSYLIGYEDGKEVHPVKKLTLSKAELFNMWRKAVDRAIAEDEGEAHEFFAEAILRKEQEK